MNRIIFFVGVWASVVVIAGVSRAADPRRSGNQAVPPAGGSSRFVAPSNTSNNNGRYSAAEVQRATQNYAARQADAARRAAAAAQQNSFSGVPTFTFYTPPSGNWFSPYRPYWPYGYPYGYVPPGLTPYVASYDPYTGATSLYPYLSGYTPYYSQFGYPYAYYRNPFLGFGYPSAVFAPSNPLFAQGPMQQLLGGGQWGPPQPQGNPNAPANALGNANGNPNPNGNLNANGNAVNPNPGLANNDAAPPAHKPPVAGGKALEIAWKFITYGDAHFGNQKFNDALDRYRRAARECPTLGDAWFRQGFALAALGRYDQAAKAFRRGLEEKPDWVDSNFRISELFADSYDKKSVLNKIVKAAEEEPTNGDVALVAGVHLFCDDKADEAAPFFRRAAQIHGNDAEVKSFLAKGQ